jgi:mono/diheme cytochrome c family protein
VPARLILACVLSLVAGAACRQDMHDQPKVRAYGEAEFFADRRGMRPVPQNTVPRGFLNDDDHLFTGKVKGQFTDEFPFQVTREVLQRGHDRFGIYCTPCHGQTGMGNGMVVQRGYRPPPSFHTDTIRNQTVGYWYDVITNGFGAMPSYRTEVAPEDRWAIAAYIRALQLSQRATTADVPADKVSELNAPPRPTTAPAVGGSGAAQGGAH